MKIVNRKICFKISGLLTNLRNMKNRDKLRIITFNGETYYWAYYYDDMDFKKYPYSYYLFIPKANNKLKVRVYFTRYAPNMKLNIYTEDGTMCMFRGEKTILNLNQPYFARQVIEYIFNHCCKTSDIGEISINDGDGILEKIGYSDF